MFVIKLLGFWQNNGDKELLFHRVRIKEINEVELHGRRGNGCAEEAQDSAGTGFCRGVLGCAGHILWRNPSLFFKRKKQFLSVTDDIV